MKELESQHPFQRQVDLLKETQQLRADIPLLYQRTLSNYEKARALLRQDEHEQVTKYSSAIIECEIKLGNIPAAFNKIDRLAKYIQKHELDGFYDTV